MPYVQTSGPSCTPSFPLLLSILPPLLEVPAQMDLCDLELETLVWAEMNRVCRAESKVSPLSYACKCVWGEKVTPEAVPIWKVNIYRRSSWGIRGPSMTSTLNESVSVLPFSKAHFIGLIPLLSEQYRRVVFCHK